jgi:hypothetical protein
MLGNLIRQYALDDARAGKWDAVATTLNALTRTVRLGKVGGKASLGALVAAGIDPDTVIAAMRANPMASELLNTLTADGVDWADDMTAYVMGKLVAAGKITQKTADVMRSLSVRGEPVIVTTPEECSAAYLVGADVLLSVNITSGVTHCSLQVSRDGRQVKIQSLVEGQGSEADQALLTAIETAINDYLIEA